MKRLSVLIVSFVFFSLQPASAAEVLPQPFFNHVNSKFLSNPGVVLIDQSSKEIIYQNSADKPRIPASVLKIFSTAAIAL
ncbi:MAG: hypothetical protein RL310_869, partial [Actinomycetota bacterium]